MLSSLFAIGISQIPLLFQLALGAALVGSGYLQWQLLSRTVVLHHHGGPDDTRNSWLIEYGAEHYEGHLVKQGYRSAGLLVLAIQSRNARWPRRLPVWIDSVSSEQFSYLNLQLMFNAQSE